MLLHGTGVRYTSLWNGMLLLYIGKGGKLTRTGEYVTGPCVSPSRDHPVVFASLHAVRVEW